MFPQGSWENPLLVYLLLEQQRPTAEGQGSCSRFRHKRVTVSIPGVGARDLASFFFKDTFIYLAVLILVMACKIFNFGM